MVQRDDGKERLAISSAGIGGMQDLLATMHVSALRGQEAPNELSYVAPELLMGDAADQRADVFTIGALMYYMATGHPPYQAESFPQLLGRMMMTGPTDLAPERPDLGADAAATIMRCIATDATYARLGDHAAAACRHRRREVSQARSQLRRAQPPVESISLPVTSRKPAAQSEPTHVCHVLSMCVSAFFPSPASSRMRHFERALAVQQHPVAVFLERFLAELPQQFRRLAPCRPRSTGRSGGSRAASNSSAIRPNCFACSDRAICWL